MKIEELKPELLIFHVMPKTVRIHSAHGYDFDALVTNTRVTNAASIEECNGIRFLCPACLKEGREHLITRWSHERGAPFYASPVRYRWKISGASLAYVSVMPDFENEMTLERDDVCTWNGMIQNGEVI